MTVGQPLRGFVSQNMRGARDNFASYGASYPAGTPTWICPKSGWYRFVQWGAGGVTGGTVSGGSGAHTQTVAHINKGQTVAIVVPAGGSDCTVTLPNGRVITAGTAAAATGGVASGGDININGSNGTAGGGGNGVAGGGDNGGPGGLGNGTTNSGGAGAPGSGGYRGGEGGSATGGAGAGTPGAGGNQTSSGGQGSGFVIIVRQNGRVSKVRFPLDLPPGPNGADTIYGALGRWS